MRHGMFVTGIALLISVPLLAQEPRHLFHASAFAVQGRADDHQIVTQAAPTFASLRGRDDGAIERYGSISDSIVRSINLASKGTKNGYALPIEGLGTLYLGHVTATPGERRLAMIRLDLGRRGMVVVGLDDVNGETMP